MTHKEKAKELIYRFNPYVSGWTQTNKPDEDPNAVYEGISMKIGRAKQCALIAVQGILSEHRGLGTNSDKLRHDEETHEEYWEKVKQEIKNY